MTRRAPPKNSQRGLILVVGGVWGLALLVGTVVIVGGVNGASPDTLSTFFAVQPWAVSPTQDTATPAPIVTQTKTPTLTQTSTHTLTPSATFTPTQTPTVTLSPTPGPSPTLAWSEGPVVIGRSVEGRPIEIYRFGTGPHRVMIVAGIHGGYEANTYWLALELIDYVQANEDIVPADRTLYILPLLNPDGYVHLHKNVGRANANNVDLNRNWTVEWAPEWPLDGCWEMLPISSGPYPASEPETIALMNFIMHHPIKALVSYHAAAPGFYPAEDPFEPQSVWLAQYLSDYSGYPYPAYQTGCYMTGSLVDWVAFTGAAAVDLELSDHWNTDLAINLRVLKGLLNWQP